MPQNCLFRWTFTLVLSCAAWVALESDRWSSHCLAQSADSPDFKLQGEYTGRNLGLQVIAVGDGEFEFALYSGGLPGAGWDGTPVNRADGTRESIEALIRSRQLQPIARQSPTLQAAPPAGAIVLFDGSEQSMQNWQPGARRTEAGLLAAGATTRQTFRDYSLHVEFQTPFMPKAEGQGRGNSGVYHQGRYETQILDSFGLEGKNNEAGGIYEIRDPDLNMCLPPLAWQTYDIDFTAARFDNSGKKIADAVLTVQLNGVTVQREVAVPRVTRAAPLKEENSPGPIYLQNHGNPVLFRNIWLVPRDAEREALRPKLPGYERFFVNGQIDGLDQAATQVLGGRMLISQLACAACHATDDPGLQPKPAPVLSQVGQRVRLDHLVGFIAQPHQHKAGTTMPDLLHGMSDEERAKTVAAITSFLAGTGSVVDRPGDAAAQSRGGKLFHSIGCVACHEPREKSDGSGPVNESRTFTGTSVPLGNLTNKYTLDSLTSFLLNPHVVRNGGLMPKLVNGRIEARDIACYLLGDAIIVPGGQQFMAKVYYGSWDKLPDFDQVPVAKQGPVGGLDLSLAGRKDEFGMRFEGWLPITEAGEYRFFLGSDDGSRLVIDGQEVMNADGIHAFSFRRGRKRLESGLHEIRIDYFERAGGEQLELEIEGPGLERSPIAMLVRATREEATPKPILVDKFQPAVTLAQAGQESFEKLGCANCHKLQMGDKRLASRLRGRPLASLRIENGCLSTGVPAAGIPDYALSPAQRRSILAAIKALDDQPASQTLMEQVRSDRAQAHIAMAEMNCYACHNRGPVGGPEKSRDSYFATRVQEMGNEARVPPPLTGVGDKLLPEVMERIVGEGAKDRPYMLTRMPAFSPAATTIETSDDAKDDRQARVVALRERLVRLDVHAAHAASSVVLNDVERQQHVIEGRKLAGSGGLACIKCHTYNQRSTPGIAAIDLLSMPKRLRPDWFHRYMLAPAEYRPGTRMPLSFPEGKSVLADVTEGNADAQIRALWLYLNEGTKVKPPSGLDGASIVLVAERKPVIYRNFIEGLGPRGIAVGYPEKVNMAWDAGTMNLVLMWKNDFIDAGKHWVGRGPGKQGPLGDFVISLPDQPALARLSEPEQAWPKRSAKEMGYRFRGYELDKEGRPIFRYNIGDTQIEDSMKPLVEGGRATGFRREMVLTASEGLKGMVMRVASGRVSKQAEEFVVDDTLKLRVTGGIARVVKIGNADELRVDLPNEKTGRLAIEMKW